MLWVNSGTIYKYVYKLNVMCDVVQSGGGGVVPPPVWGVLYSPNAYPTLLLYYVFLSFPASGFESDDEVANTAFVEAVSATREELGHWGYYSTGGTESQVRRLDDHIGWCGNVSCHHTAVGCFAVFISACLPLTSLCCCELVTHVRKHMLHALLWIHTICTSNNKLIIFFFWSAWLFSRQVV